MERPPQKANQARTIWHIPCFVSRKDIQSRTILFQSRTDCPDVIKSNREWYEFMENQVTLQLFSYWNHLKGARQAPERSEIEPADIKDLLPDTFILETDALEGTTFRLAGTRTCALFGRDLKNEDFLNIWSEADRVSLSTSLRILRDEATVVTASWEGRTARHHDTSGELILLPLFQDNAVCRILGTLVTTEAPYWLGTFPLTSMTLTGLRMVMAREHTNPVYSKSPVPAVHPTLGINRPSRQIRHLSLYEGGRDNV